MVKFNKNDLKIIKEISKEPRIRITEIAKNTGISRTTIDKRLKKLLADESIQCNCGFSAEALEYKIAAVGLENKNMDRSYLENLLSKCPRVISMYRTLDKANIVAHVWGEDVEAITALVESFRDFIDVEIVFLHFLGVPIYGNVIIDSFSLNEEGTPCGKACKECSSYLAKFCPGCPASVDYIFSNQ